MLCGPVGYFCLYIHQSKVMLLKEGQVLYFYPCLLSLQGIVLVHVILYNTFQSITQRSLQCVAYGWKFPPLHILFTSQNSFCHIWYCVLLYLHVEKQLLFLVPCWRQTALHIVPCNEPPWWDICILHKRGRGVVRYISDIMRFDHLSCSCHSCCTLLVYGCVTPKFIRFLEILCKHVSCGVILVIGLYSTENRHTGSSVPVCVCYILIVSVLDSPFQFPGPVLHLTEVDPAPDRQLHGDPEVAARDPDLPEQLPPETQGLCQPGQQHSHLPTGAHQTGGKGLQKGLGIRI